MSLLNSGAVVGLLSALEGTFNVQPTTGWRTNQPNSDGIQGFIALDKKVARQPLSPNMQREKGDIVDRDANPKIVHDLTKEWLDDFAPGSLLSLEKWPGGTGVGRWAVTPTATGVVAVTAVAAGAYTVASGGALTAGTLLFARGFTNAANNGLQIVAAASTGISIKVTAAVLEASPPANATLEVVGFQFASADLTSTATTLGCTVASFTAMGLQQYAWLWVGGGTAAAPGALGYASATNRGFIRMTSITATTITFDRAITTWVTDAGAGKTIQIFFGPWIRGVAKTHADRLEQTYNLELSVPGLDSGGATDYAYGYGMMVSDLEINAPKNALVVATLGFMGTNVTTWSTTRATGASTAPSVIATAPFNTATEIRRIPRLVDSSGNVNLANVQDWKLTLKNNIDAPNQQGTLGPFQLLPGEMDVDVAMTGFLMQPDLMGSIHNNTTLAFDVALANGDGGVLLDVPAGTFVDGTPKFPQNTANTLAGNLMAHRDPVTNMTFAIQKYAYLPAS